MGIYESTIEKLNSFSEKGFKEFSSKIVNSQKTLLGVKVPTLRSLSKEIFNKDCEAYLNNCRFLYFEDTLLYGFLIANFDYEKFIKYLPKYLNEIDSWAHVDNFVCSIKCLKKQRDKFFDYIKNNERSFQGFHLRFLTICLLNAFVDQSHIDYIFEYAVKHDGKGYYNDMAIAWLISVCFVKFRDKTLDFIKNCKLSSFTLNKSISKIKDSFRVTREDKILLQNFIRKK